MIMILVSVMNYCNDSQLNIKRGLQCVKIRMNKLQIKVNETECIMMYNEKFFFM